MWIPVMFACFLGGDCKFFADPVFIDFAECKAHIDAHLLQAQKTPDIRAATGACIPVRFSGGSPIKSL